MENEKKKGKLLIQKLEKLILQSEFISDVKAERRKLKLPPEGIQNSQKAIRAHARDSFSAVKFDPNYELGKDRLSELLKKYKLDDRYRNLVRNYIFFKEFFSEEVPEFLENNKRVHYFTESLDSEDWTGANLRIFMEIYAETTIKDIQKIWQKEIKPLQKRAVGYKKGRNTTPKNFERDRKIYELHVAGKSIKEIKAAISEEFGLVMMPHEIRKIIARFKDRNIGK